MNGQYVVVLGGGMQSVIEILITVNSSNKVSYKIDSITLF